MNLARTNGYLRHPLALFQEDAPVRSPGLSGLNIAKTTKRAAVPSIYSSFSTTYPLTKNIFSSILSETFHPTSFCANRRQKGTCC